MDYESCLKRLQYFVNGLSETHVKILYFLKSDLKHPKLKTRFRKWVVDGSNCFVMPGKDPNFVYVYSHTEAKKLVTVVPDLNSGSFTSQPAPIQHVYNVKVTNHEDGDTLVGDHVDFSISGVRKTGKVVVRSHLTYYDDLEKEEVKRNDLPCNFYLDTVVLKNITTFGSINCIGKNDVPLGTVPKRVYQDKTYLNVVFELCQIVAGLQSGGRAMVTYKENRYVINTGKRGGSYIDVGNRKVYLKRPLQGGANNTIEYKGVTFMSDAFVSFISEYIISKVGRLRHDLECAHVFFDEANEIVHNGNHHIVIVYDFEEDKRSVFYVNTITALTACYADNRLNSKQEITPHERRCVEAFKNDIIQGKRPLVT